MNVPYIVICNIVNRGDLFFVHRYTIYRGHDVARCEYVIYVTRKIFRIRLVRLWFVVNARCNDDGIYEKFTFQNDVALRVQYQ